MWLRVADGKPYFATHVVHVEVTDEIRERISLQIEEAGVVCYSVDELNFTKQVLDELGVNYIIEELNPDPALIVKTDGIRYLTPEEVIAHIFEDKEPQSQIIFNLKNIDLLQGQEIVRRDLEGLVLKAENAVIGSQIVCLELKLLSLERGS